MGLSGTSPDPAGERTIQETNERGDLPAEGSVASTRRRRAARFARRHALFGVVLFAAIAVRVIAMLGYPLPLLFPDSRDYIGVTMRMQPYQVRPSGYPAMLWLLKPFHSLAAVAGVQHAMGLGMGVAGYALLRRRFRLPGWAATLAMAPVLLSAYAVQLEHFLLSDTLFAFLVTVAVVVLLWRPVPPLASCAVAGLLLAAAILVRSEGIPLLVVFVAWLLIRWSGWRTVAAIGVMCVAFALPVASYASWFKARNGTFDITTSTGAWLYSRVIPFADCAVSNPPPSEQGLCLDIPPSQRQGPVYYLWTSSSPIHKVAGGPFGSLANRLGTGFALRAIRAQPGQYLSAVWSSFWQSFLLHNGTSAAARLQRDYMFVAAAPAPVPHAVSVAGGYADDDLYSYNGGADPNPRLVQPFAGWILGYQRFLVVSGPLLGVIALAGLAGLIAACAAYAVRHHAGARAPGEPATGGQALLPWLTGIALLVIPAATAGFDPRYVVSTIPSLCLAAAIGVKQIVSLAARPTALAGAARKTAAPARSR